jgi:hypothetical protein
MDEKLRMRSGTFMFVYRRALLTTSDTYIDASMCKYACAGDIVIYIRPDAFGAEWSVVLHNGRITSMHTEALSWCHVV